MGALTDEMHKPMHRRMEGGGMKRLILILIALSVSGWGGVQLGGGVEAAAPPAGGWTLDDQFAAEIAGWAARNGGACSNVSGELQLASGGGICHYTDGSGDGDNPTTEDHWVVMEYGASANLNAGVGVRHATSGTPGTGVYNYTARCDGNGLTIRICNSDDSCTSLADEAGGCSIAAGAQIALMVAGAHDTTDEICAWWWDAGSETWNDPTTWKSADFCVSGSATTPLIDAYGIDTTTATKEDWDVVGCGGAGTGSPTSTNCGSRGYPVSGQTHISYYSGDGNTHSAEWLVAGDL